MHHSGSISVVYPVSNAENSLDLQLHALLEVLPELCATFEIVIVDDGSRDETWDVARELATCYPQISIARHPLPLGRDAAIRTALEMSRGEILLVCDRRNRLNLHELGRLWQRIERCDFVFGRAIPSSPGYSPAGLAPRPTLESFDPHESLQMVRRRAIGRVQWPISQGRALLAAIGANGFRYEVIYLADAPSPVGQAASKPVPAHWLETVRTNRDRLAGARVPSCPQPAAQETLAATGRQLST